MNTESHAKVNIQEVSIPFQLPFFLDKYVRLNSVKGFNYFLSVSFSFSNLSLVTKTHWSFIITVTITISAMTKQKNKYDEIAIQVTEKNDFWQRLQKHIAQAWWKAKTISDSALNINCSTTAVQKSAQRSCMVLVINHAVTFKNNGEFFFLSINPGEDIAKKLQNTELNKLPWNCSPSWGLWCP